MKLSNYFQPLLPTNIFVFIFLFIFFDSLGIAFRKKIISNSEEFRTLDWLIGLGLYIFIWFFLGLYIVPSRNNIVISLAVIGTPVLLYYFKNKYYISLKKTVWDLKLVFILFIPFLFAVFVKSSLPPYQWDEMAYHFISPLQLSKIKTWKFTGNIYSDLPRLMDTLYIITFSLTRTYSVARLIHFNVFFTSLLFSYQILRKNIGKLLSLVFVLIIFTVDKHILSAATSGYVDMANFSFILIAVVSGLRFLLNNKKELLVISTVFWSMALGTKYSAIPALSAFLPLLMIYIIFNKKIREKIFTLSFLLKLLGLSTIFGGYWYIKNYIVFGNPFFPFIFDCKGQFAGICESGRHVMDNWTYPVTPTNMKLILGSLLISKFFSILIFLIALFVLFNKEKHLRNVSLVLFAMIGIELIMINYSSGYMPRFYTHLRIFIILFALIQLVGNFRGRITKLIVNILTVLLVSFTLYKYTSVVLYVNSFDFITKSQIKYSVRLLDLYQWVDERFPITSGVIRWCDNQRGNTVNLGQIDPQVIWYDYQGLIRVYMTHCSLFSSGLRDLSPGNLNEEVINRKTQLYLVSISECMSNEEIDKKYSDKTEGVKKLALLNNSVVCQSEKISTGLYYFDYTKLEDREDSI